MPSRNQAFRARASRNCANCRAVKRRCDQQLPHCGQCIRMRQNCPGYRDEWELVFRDQTDHTVKRFKAQTAKKATTARYCTSPTLGPSPSFDEIGVNYFLHNFVTGGHGYLNYVPTIYSVDTEHPTLVTSMAAVGLVALANSSRQPQLVRQARAKYSEAICYVNHALTSPVEAIKDSTLMSVISLGVFEHVTDFESWFRHVRGAAALVIARGKNQFTTKTSILLFNQVRADMAAACLHTFQPFPEELRELQEEASKHTDTSNAFWHLGVYAARSATFLGRVAKKKREIPLPDLLKEAIALQDDFECVQAMLAIAEPYTITQKPVGDLDMIYNGRFDLYRSSWAIRMWNNWRVLQIIVCEIVCWILKRLLATDLEPSVRTNIKLRFQETSITMTRLGDDVLATVPQALGFSSRSTPQFPVNFSSGTSVSGSYLLIWCLFSVGKSPVTKRETRRWIIRHLQDIVTNAGIAMARQLADELVDLDLQERSIID